MGLEQVALRSQNRSQVYSLWLVFGMGFSILLGVLDFSSVLDCPVGTPSFLREMCATPCWKGQNKGEHTAKHAVGLGPTPALQVSPIAALFYKTILLCG